MNSSERTRSDIHTEPRTNTFRIFGALFSCLLAVASASCGQKEELAPRPRQPSLHSTQPALAATEPATTELAAPTPANSPGSKLAVYELKMTPRDLAALERNAFSNETVPADFIADGKTYQGVRVRYRGAWARSWPKKPLKIFFAADNPFEGQRRISLNSSWRDPAFIREKVAYDIYAACGVPASTSRMARLLINGKFRGLYVQVEQPDKAFAKRYKLKGASIYKANSHSNQADERDHGGEQQYRAHYEKETQEESGYSELQTFCEGL